MKTALKITIGIFAAAAVVALVMIATRMDSNTDFLAAGRKWIEEIGEGISGNKAAIEVYEEEYAGTPEKESEGASEAVYEIMSQTVETLPMDIISENELMVAGEGDDQIVGGDFYIDDDDEESTSSSSNKNQNSNQEKEITEESENERTKEQEGLPKTYDEYLKLSLDERIAIAESMGDDYDPWIENLKAHQDDDKIIITATDQMETLE